jgi:hypothetical protein
MNAYTTRAKETLKELIIIDRSLKRIEKIDPYGDMIENFADLPDKYPPCTKRLIKMIKKDLKIGYWEKYKNILVP